MQDKWWEEKVDEIQDFADSNKSKQFFSSIKAVFGPSKSGFTPLLARDGTTHIKDKTGITNRWREQQQPELTELDVSSTMDEIRKAIKQMSCGKAPGKDGIPAEVCKALSDDALSASAFHSVLVSIWEEEELPADLRDATIVALLNKKQRPRS
ncbi:uncharacterized protein LOC123524684 [Mercenaria mercenaria]|uniref:uncharacterized protein LOC123524684 n=1 Tax=Mercenaria mercenaria TaxID=6596 RepID=UPI00234FACBF|nr:uncharacterized protein LOC123524684 [Mercenaria mercenaria]